MLFDARKFIPNTAVKSWLCSVKATEYFCKSFDIPHLLTIIAICPLPHDLAGEANIGGFGIFESQVKI